MTTICAECGANIAAGKKFCPECGKPVKAEIPQEAVRVETVYTPVSPAVPATPAVLATPAAPAPINISPPPPAAVPPARASYTGEQPPDGSPYAVMRVGGYVGASILMGIPVIGWIICIVWACGGCKNRNQRNFARAYLIFLAIGAILGFVGYLMLNWLIDVAIEVLRGM